MTDASSNVPLEAARFCAAHLSGMPSEECVGSLVEQVETIRKLRRETQDALPGITFTVRNAEGQDIRFVHDAGANPRDEAYVFCEQHFAAVPIDDCIEAVRRPSLEPSRGTPGTGASALSRAPVRPERVVLPRRPVSTLLASSPMLVVCCAPRRASSNTRAVAHSTQMLGSAQKALEEVRDKNEL